MAIVRTELTMSLDGYITGPNDSPSNPLGDGGNRLFEWYYNGDTELKMAGAGMSFKVSQASAAFLEPYWNATGAGITGRRTFDIAGAWGGNPPGGGKYFVVTHSPPQEWEKPGSPFIFVTDGVEHAVALAKQAAGDKDVHVMAASLVQQCLKAGLLDEIQVDLVPVLLGKGTSLFGSGNAVPANLEILQIVQGQGVTHLRYRVVK